MHCYYGATICSGVINYFSVKGHFGAPLTFLNQCHALAFWPAGGSATAQGRLYRGASPPPQPEEWGGHRPPNQKSEFAIVDVASFPGSILFFFCVGDNICYVYHCYPLLLPSATCEYHRYNCYHCYQSFSPTQN